MRISEGMLQSGGVDALKKASGLHKAQGKESSSKRSADSVNISGKARRLSANSAEKANVMQRAAASSETRQDRIDEVKARVQSGFYDSEEFQDKLADRLMNHFGFRE